MNTDSDKQSSIPPKEDDRLGITFSNIPTPAEESGAAEKSGTGNSHLTNHDDVFNVTKAYKSDGTETGTIVSDKRGQRQSLGKNLHEAFSEWWGHTQKKLEGTLETVEEIRHHEEPVIEKAETRIDTIKEASTHTRQVPKDDHEHIAEKLKKVSEGLSPATPVPLVIKKELEKKKAAWTHVVEKPQPPEPETTDHIVSKQSTPIIQKMRTYSSDVAQLQGGQPDVKIQESSSEKIPLDLPIEAEGKPQENQITPAPKIESVDFRKEMVAPVIKRDTGNSGQKKYPSSQNNVKTNPPYKREARDSQKELVSTSPSSVAPLAPNQPKHGYAAIEESEPQKSREPVEHIADKLATPQQPSTTTSEVEYHRSSQAMFRGVDRQNPAEHTTQKTPTTSLGKDASSSIPQKAGVGSLAKWLILLGVAVLGVILALLTFFFVRSTSDSSSSQVSETEIVVSQFFKTKIQTSIQLKDSRENFLTLLTSSIQNAQAETTQLYPVISDENTHRLATTEEVLVFLDARLPLKTLDSFDENFMIGSVMTTKNEPYVVLRSYNFDVLFSGLLAWEQYLYEDLRPLFMSDKVPASNFVDAVQNNKSIRILKDTFGNEILLSAFINQNTVILTSSSNALSKLLQNF
ncbi:MAG: hypothetical protein K9M10_02535 [Candidatus Pacebacteria bacterium]|nr:hypothetical protein [Candidatus Paceibacterota bacterium]MCF7857333.1 hypothetical protein [Candidatus Paceibacterota bacterium]